MVPLELIAVSFLALGLSFVFALGGVGSAVALVPILHWLGFPLNEAKPTGLFVNTISLIGATYVNIKERRLDFRLGLPIIVASIFVAPLGAYVSTLVDRRVVLAVFTVFLLFSGNMMLFFEGSRYGDQFREDRPMATLIGIGFLAGFISGLLGVGGGGVVVPLMILAGFNPKKVAVITAFVIPFSSLAGFIAYLAMGYFNALLVLPVGIASYMGGYLGTHFMQRKLSPRTVKKFLAYVVLFLALNMIIKM
jgi:uncharacterized membrane protein YfcA